MSLPIEHLQSKESKGSSTDEGGSLGSLRSTAGESRDGSRGLDGGGAVASGGSQSG